ncbi:transcription factor-like 5 protein [Sphaerodactylus townsendi]|uniref:transcription factor-like 5 protein n=1 Tax=Sphaerodactylus townsendi TaxID=933632 RepID=UPI002026CA31|nr:transcription factor-like 5 protein [Sphaerodactylus townsendi]
MRDGGVTVVRCPCESHVCKGSKPDGGRRRRGSSGSRGRGAIWAEGLPLGAGVPPSKAGSAAGAGGRAEAVPVPGEGGERRRPPLACPPAAAAEAEPGGRARLWGHQRASERTSERARKAGAAEAAAAAAAASRGARPAHGAAPRPRRAAPRPASPGPDRAAGRRRRPVTSAARPGQARLRVAMLLLPPSRGRARRRRKERLLGQLCALASLLPLLLLACCARAGRADGYDALNFALETNDKWIGRRLLQEGKENVTDNPEEAELLYLKNCTEPGRMGFGLLPCVEFQPHCYIQDTLLLSCINTYFVPLHLFKFIIL